MKRLYEEGIIYDVQDSGKRLVKVALTRFKKDFRNDWNVITDWIRAYQPATGEGAEGTFGKLGIGDYVIVSFRDYPDNQLPFVAFKNLSTDDDNIDVGNDKKIKYNDHTIDFEDNGSIVITHKEGSSITIKDGEIELEKGSQINQLLVGVHDLIAIFNTHTHNGNLGYPTLSPLLPIVLTQVDTSLKVK
jgi:hypothetical protein